MTKIIRFAHLADLHLGGWREKKLTQLNVNTFKLAIEKIIKTKVDFVLFSGDIFNSAIPPIELVEIIVKELMKLKENNIPLYVIGGSHDYSNSGKSFISLLEATGLFIDVSKYETIDKGKVNLVFFKDKSGANITGILGKKNGLDKNIYTNLNHSNLDQNNFNIFMFHTTLNDIKPDFLKVVDSEIKSNYLPKGFDYYAGGHIHTYIEKTLSATFNSKSLSSPTSSLSSPTSNLQPLLSYPGPLFPNNFRELINEKPSFNFCEFNFENRKTTIKREFLNTYEKEYIKIEISNLNPIEATEKIKTKLETIKIESKIILLEIYGKVEGKITDIKLNQIIHNLYENGAYCILKNTYKLTTTDLEKIEISNVKNILEIEEEITKKALQESPNKNNEINLTKKLLETNLSKQQEEKTSQYENRIKEIMAKILI